MKQVVISHKNCPDGCASVILSKVVYPQIEYVMSIHNVIDDIVCKKAFDLEEGGELILIDICCSKAALDKAAHDLLGKEASLYIYEHHESQKWLLDYDFPQGLKGEVIFNNDACASKIFYETWVHKNEALKTYADFIEVINDRDLWINKRKEGQDIATLCNILGDASFINRFFKNPSVDLLHREKILLEYQRKKDEEKIAKLLSKIELAKDREGYKYGLMYGEGNASDLLNKALETHDLEYAILLNLNTKTGSIRGRGNFDCALFASKYNGGGHRKASGFRVNFDYKFPQEE